MHAKHARRVFVLCETHVTATSISMFTGHRHLLFGIRRSGLAAKNDMSYVVGLWRNEPGNVANITKHMMRGGSSLNVREFATRRVMHTTFPKDEIMFQFAEFVFRLN